MTVSALLEAARLRDPYLGPHMRAVSRLSRRVGSEMGFSEEMLDLLGAGALLHDVGKVCIPDAILRKPGPLTRDEYEIMKSHAVLGAEILFREGLPEAVPVAKYHHERFDGEGYPDGLRGKEIPLAARIVCVTDAMDSMVRDKVYQRGASKRMARSEIVRNSGTQFDPKVVAALAEVLRGPNGRRKTL